MNNQELLDNKINMKNIDAYYDLYDKATLYLVEKANLNYLQAFLRVYNDIKDANTSNKGLSENEVEKLSEYEDRISGLYILNEEIRVALVLILIKAFKHVDASLDLISPDYIGY